MGTSRMFETKQEQAVRLDGKVQALGVRDIKLNQWSGLHHRAPVMEAQGVWSGSSRRTGSHIELRL